MRVSRCATAAAAAWLAALAQAAAPVGTAFTYQGRLTDANVAATGTYDMMFTLFDAPSGGNQVGPALTGNDMPVSNGLFSTPLDFGSTVFNGNALWLEIQVRPGASGGSYSKLTPRQQLTAAPFAAFSGAPWITNGYNINYNLGNVGIGALTPLTPLDVRGASQSAQGVISGLQVAGSATGAGVIGKSNVSGGNGVIGEANGNNAYAIWGRSDVGFAGFFDGKTYLSGKVGIGTSTPTALLDVHEASSNVAVRAVSDGANSFGIDAWGTSAGIFATAVSDAGDGMIATTMGNNGDGVYAYGYGTNSRGVTAAAGSGQGVHAAADTGYALWAYANSPGWAGHFTGRVEITGNLSKAGGSFKIDHPLDPANKFLYHSFVESPEMMNIYNGDVTTDARGYATVTMPEWFDALNRDFRYQLTVIDSTDSSDFVLAKITHGIEKNQFTLRTSAPATHVSWQVTGVRKDAWAEAHRIPVEEEKTGKERGKYMHPELFDQPAEQGIYFEGDQTRRSPLPAQPKPAPAVAAEPTKGD